MIRRQMRLPNRSPRHLEHEILHQAWEPPHVYLALNPAGKLCDVEKEWAKFCESQRLLVDL